MQGFSQPTAPGPVIPKSSMNKASFVATMGPGGKGFDDPTATTEVPPKTNRAMFTRGPQSAPALADPGAFGNKMAGGSGMRSGSSPTGGKTGGVMAS